MKFPNWVNWILKFFEAPPRPISDDALHYWIRVEIRRASNVD